MYLRLTAIVKINLNDLKSMKYCKRKILEGCEKYLYIILVYIAGQLKHPMKLYHNITGECPAGKQSAGCSHMKMIAAFFKFDILQQETLQLTHVFSIGLMSFEKPKNVSL